MTCFIVVQLESGWYHSVMHDGKGLLDEPYKYGDPSEHGIYQTYNLALYTSIPHRPSNSLTCGTIGQVLRMHGPDGGFHTGYDPAGTCAGTQENAKTTSTAITTLTILAAQPPFPFFSVPSWALYVFIGLVAATVTAVALILFFVVRRKTTTPR